MIKKDRRRYGGMSLLGGEHLLTGCTFHDLRSALLKTANPVISGFNRKILMSKIRKSARGQDCQLMIYPYCNHKPETTVLCHLPSEQKGMSIKSPDWWAAYGCSTCHDIIDGRMKTDLSIEDIKHCMMRGLFRTQKLLFENQLLEVK